MTGIIYGVPGGSLDERSASWASSKGAADYGRRGEELLGEKLNEIVRDSAGAAIFHDVDDPSGSSGNIDHVILAGDRLLVIDSKVWAPGFYYPLSGSAFRGFFKRFASADTTRFDSLMRISRSLSKISRTSLEPVIITVMPSSLFWRQSQTRPVRTLLLRAPGGAKITPTPPTLRAARRFVKRGGIADHRAATRLRTYTRD